MARQRTGRLGSLELDDLDLDESVDDSVTVVEWGHGIAGLLADSYLEIRIIRLDDDTRTVELIAHHGDWDSRTAEVLRLVKPLRPDGAID